MMPSTNAEYSLQKVGAIGAGRDSMVGILVHKEVGLTRRISGGRDCLLRRVLPPFTAARVHLYNFKFLEKEKTSFLKIIFQLLTL
jgi:hypothetical protein